MALAVHGYKLPAVQGASLSRQPDWEWVDLSQIPHRADTRPNWLHFGVCEANVALADKYGVALFDADAAKEDADVAAQRRRAYLRLGAELGASGDAICGIACGEEHVVLFTERGRAFGWGRNQYGEVGQGNTRPVESLQPITATRHEGCTVKGVAAARSASFFLVAEGPTGGTPTVLMACGLNKQGQLGLWRSERDCAEGKNEVVVQPRAVQLPLLGGEGLSSVASRSAHTLAVTDRGRILAWGLNLQGQLGLGHTSEKELPQSVGAFASTKVRQVSCGLCHSIALTNTGDVYTFGTLPNLPYPQPLPDVPDMQHKLPPFQLPDHRASAAAADHPAVAPAAAASSGAPFSVAKGPERVSGLPNSVCCVSAGSTFSAALAADGEGKAKLLVWGKQTGRSR
ncbi:unnamed protein product [Vitrella brassicaformis CCMP3155]|uniref:Regulator of chromosome condensation n=1 Tax=Vitrella brassicaformis (strain CCMP3155) TaxID=1169540 RepID=A0A0G4EF28_VITBC|nr:unnamed protein product [Vitrella brassicaformis CCMP3155]|eukprot:CEL94015.1 unnamed protein product [Vitrella brassicaformis CCMP3155]